MIIFAEPILKLLFPNATSGAFIYQISSLSIIFIVLEQTISGALHGLGKMLVPAIALAIGSTVKIILNCYLVPINPNIFILGGTAGAALSTVICHMISVIIEFKSLKKEINLKLNSVKFFIKPCIATCIMGIISNMIYKSLITPVGEKISLIISILLAALVYLICIIILKVFTKEEIFMIPFGKKVYDFISFRKKS